jgi:hypothetical protein
VAAGQQRRQCQRHGGSGARRQCQRHGGSGAASAGSVSAMVAAERRAQAVSAPWWQRSGDSAGSGSAGSGSAAAVAQRSGGSGAAERSGGGIDSSSAAAVVAAVGARLMCPTAAPRPLPALPALPPLRCRLCAATMALHYRPRRATADLNGITAL